MTAVDTVIFKSLWLVGRHLPAFLLRLYFSGSRLANLVYVDIRPRHDPVTVDLSPAASTQIFLHVLNLAPIPVELDRAEFRLMFGGGTVKMAILRKQTFAVGEFASLYLHESIPDSTADIMARSPLENPISLDGHIEFNSAIRNFSKTVGTLEGIHVRFINRAQRRSAIGAEL